MKVPITVTQYWAALAVIAILSIIGVAWSPDTLIGRELGGKIYMTVLASLVVTILLGVILFRFHDPKDGR